MFHKKTKLSLYLHSHMLGNCNLNSLLSEKEEEEGSNPSCHWNHHPVSLSAYNILLNQINVQHVKSTLVIANTVKPY